MENPVVLITLIVYKIILILIGLWAQRRTHDEEDFLLGGRQLGALSASISYAASAASAWTLLGMTGAAYVLGISALWIALGAVLGAWVAWRWVGPRMMHFSREHKILTLTDFLCHGSGVYRQRITTAASLIILFAFIFYISSQFQAAGNTFATTFNMKASPSIILGGGIIMAYTMLGGFWAVCLTDTLQGLLMAAAALLLPVSAYLAIGGWQPFIDGLLAVSTPDQLSLSGKNIGLFAIGAIVGNLATGLGTFGQPHLLARFMAIRDETAMRHARHIAMCWYVVVFGGMCFLGLAGQILAPTIENPENLFFHLNNELFPPVLGAILLAAVLSAIMSTADSMLLVAASSLSHDLDGAKRLGIGPVFATRLIIVLLSGLAIWVAIDLPATIFNRVLFAWVAIGSAFGPLIIVRLAGRAVSGRQALLSICCGFVSAVIFSFLPDAPGDLAERTLPFCCGLLPLLIAKPQRTKQPSTDAITP